MLNSHRTLYIRWPPHEHKLMYILMALFLIATTFLLNNQTSAQGLTVIPAQLKSILTNQHQEANNRQQISNITRAMTTTANTNTNSFALHTHQRKSSESSSSFFADIEDLTDSSIRSRVGQLAAEPRDQPILDFDSLIERLTRPIAGLSRLKHTFREQQPFSQLQMPFIKTPADANNKTTMRFFRNNKTFASIVYTDDHKQQQQQQPLSSNQFSGIRKARRLINCHLVDLEKHASDVALFEAKYEIETVDIEFRDMMSIIEACTDIARFKPLKTAGGSSSPLAMLPNNAGGIVQQQQQQQQQQSSSFHDQAVIKPFVVVGRLAPSIQSPVLTQFPLPSATTTMTTQASSNSLSTFQNVMSESINKELNSLSSTKSGIMTTDLGAGSGNLRVRRKLTAGNGIANNNNPQQQQRTFTSQGSYQQRKVNGSGGLLSTALARVSETGKKLVLGEVTPPPSAIDGRSGGIKEALQEITQYDTSDLMAIWRGILPGTNWCGMGDRATSYNDLGFESDIDICCRAHDFCPIRLSAFSAGYGLFNWSFYTRSHCRCDQNFLDCLQRAESPLSQVVLKFYFNIMKTTCLHDNETTSSHQHFWTSGGGNGNSNSNVNFNSMMSKQQQQQLSQKPSLQLQKQPLAGQRQQTTQLLVPSNEQQRLLLEQIRASLPIPALEHSTSIASATEQRRVQLQ